MEGVIVYNFRKNKKKLVAFCIMAVFSITTVAVYAATEHWEDASTKPQIVTKTLVSNNTDWQAWKDSWNSIKTNYEQVSLAPGADFSKLNFGWYSKEKANVAKYALLGPKTWKMLRYFRVHAMWEL